MTFKTQQKVNSAHDELRRTKHRAGADTGDVIDSPGVSAKEAKAQATALSPKQNTLPSGIHHDSRVKESDVFGYLKAVQIKGLDSQKTMFTKQDFKTIRKEFVRAAQPLVLVRQTSSDESITRFLHGPEQLKSLGRNFSETLQGQEITIFMGSETETFTIPRLILNDKIFGSDALDAILGSSDNISSQERPGADKCLLAALLQSRVLGVVNEKMAALIRNSVPENMRHKANTCALFTCIGSGLPEVGRVLLSWGANPNGIRPSDDFGMIQQAVICKDTAFIKLLLEHGADPTRDTGSCNSALEYVDLPDFLDMKPYLTDSGNKVS